MPNTEQVDRLAQRALQLVHDDSLTEAAKLEQLRWIAKNDHGILDAAMETALAAEETLQHRNRAIQLLARVRYQGDEAPQD